MRIAWKPLASLITMVSLLFWIAPVESMAQSPGGRLEGLVLDVDGRPASGHRIHLIDGQGKATERSVVDEDGMYSFDRLASGDYSLGVESPDGTVAAVVAPAVRVGKRELARRDLKLVQADATAVGQAVEANYGFSMWWHSLPAGGKAWTIVAIVVAAGLTYDALDSEREGSRFEVED